jgi:hypothetical protein
MAVAKFGWVRLFVFRKLLVHSETGDKEITLNEIWLIFTGSEKQKTL